MAFSESFGRYLVYEGRWPLSPAMAEAFLHAPLLHKISDPPAMGFVASKLQAERMACSWFNSTRKSCGGLYGFFSVMMRPYLLARTPQWVNQRLVQRRLGPRKSDVTIIGDWSFSCAAFPSRIRGLLVAKCIDLAGTAGRLALVSHAPDFPKQHLGGMGERMRPE